MSMNDQQIDEMLKELNIPCSYHHFDKEVTPPFLIYVDEPPTYIRADGVIFGTIRNVTFELYADFKENSLIQKVEMMFAKHNIRYQKQEDWIEKEELFEFAFFCQP